MKYCISIVDCDDNFLLCLYKWEYLKNVNMWVLIHIVFVSMFISTFLQSTVLLKRKLSDSQLRHVQTRLSWVSWQGHAH